MDDNILSNNDVVGATYPTANTYEMACGENPKRVYGKRGGPQTRMGIAWTMRRTYEKARVLVRSQDDWDASCAAGRRMFLLGYLSSSTSNSHLVL